MVVRDILLLRNPPLNQPSEPIKRRGLSAATAVEALGSCLVICHLDKPIPSYGRFEKGRFYFSTSTKMRRRGTEPKTSGIRKCLRNLPSAPTPLPPYQVARFPSIHLSPAPINLKSDAIPAPAPAPPPKAAGPSRPVTPLSRPLSRLSLQKTPVKCGLSRRHALLPRYATPSFADRS